jgi:hypothetical protein
MPVAKWQTGKQGGRGRRRKRKRGERMRIPGAGDKIYPSKIHPQ